MVLPLLIPTSTPRQNGLSSLPTSILNYILEDLSVTDLCSLAQVNKRLNRAVYGNNEIWIQRLRNMNLWSHNKSIVTEPKQSHQQNAFPNTSANITTTSSSDGISADILDISQLTSKCTPENARVVYMKIYKTLYPLYIDTVQSGTHTEPLLFRLYRDTITQAQILAQLKIFAKSDPLEKNHYENLESFNSVYEMFENAALAEFEQGYDQGDINGRVAKYAKVLVTLNGGESCVQLFTQKNQLVYEKLMSAEELVEKDTMKLNNKKLQEVLTKVADDINKEAKVIDSLFPSNVPVLLPLCEHIIEDNIVELFNSILLLYKDEEQDVDTTVAETKPHEEKHVSAQTKMYNYLEVVPFLYVHMMWFINELDPTSNAGPDFKKKLKHHFINVYDLHIDEYLKKEYDQFEQYALKETQKWNEQIAQQEEATETFLFSNVTKAKDKKDMLASFKKVLMMPVSVLPFPSKSSSTGSGLNSKNNSTLDLSNQAADSTSSNGVTSSNVNNGAFLSSGSSTPIRPGTPSFASTSRNPNSLTHQPFRTASASSPSFSGFGASSVGLPLPPTTELDAKAAVLKNKLEGINTLFSLELALDIMKRGRDSIERARKLIGAGGEVGEQAREVCENVFVELVRTVGGIHVKEGFDKALQVLNNYDAKTFQQNRHDNDSDSSGPKGVEPLAIFAELVNIGDLIQQMIHVFFEEELAIPGYVDRISFISPANREKKKFEKMLDSYVAIGMNRGIDVLMDQIDYILLTEQKGSDYNPVQFNPYENFDNNASSEKTGANSHRRQQSNAFSSTTAIDISPSQAAQHVVSLLTTHVNLLQGSTDKSVIDVFQQEIGVRVFSSLCKHIKRQVISVDGAVKLLGDLNLYYDFFVVKLRQRPVAPYFVALKEVGQIFLIGGEDKEDAKALGRLLSDMSRFGGIFQPEEVFEFAQCREDWLRVKKHVEKVLYGLGMSDCTIM